MSSYTSLHLAIACVLLCALGEIIFIYNIFGDTCAGNSSTHWTAVWSTVDMVPSFTELAIIPKLEATTQDALEELLQEPMTKTNADAVFYHL